MTTTFARGVPIETAASAPGRPDVDGDVRRVWDVLADGGVSIFPTSAGYAFWSGSASGAQRIVDALGDSLRLPLGVLMGPAHEDAQLLDDVQRDIVDCITKDLGLPLSVIAPFRSEHPLVRELTADSDLRRLTTADGCVATVIDGAGTFKYGGGVIVREMERRSVASGHPIVGGSVTVPGGSWNRAVKDIDADVLDCADIVLDYGLTTDYHFGSGATQINFATMEVVRAGFYYAYIAQVLRQHFGWEFPGGLEKDPAFV
jgi:hypothetical protein